MTELGAIGAIGGGITALIAGVLLAAFFATWRESFGRANDGASALMAVLLIPAALAVLGIYQATGAFIVLVTLLGLAGMVVAAVASILTAAGRMTVAQLTLWQGGSFGIVFVWVLGVSVPILAFGLLPAGLGWLGILAGLLVSVASGSIVVYARRPGGLAAIDMKHPPLVPLVSFLAGFLCFPVWSIRLGLSL
jgi:hypothetical protein